MSGRKRDELHLEWLRLADAGVLKIRADKRAHALIAKDFGVDRSTVSQIKRRASWRHI